MPVPVIVVDSRASNSSNPAFKFGSRKIGSCGQTIALRSGVSRASNSRDGRYRCRKNPHDGPYLKTAIRLCPAFTRFADP